MNVADNSGQPFCDCGRIARFRCRLVPVRRPRTVGDWLGIYAPRWLAARCKEHDHRG